MSSQPAFLEHRHVSICLDSVGAFGFAFRYSFFYMRRDNTRKPAELENTTNYASSIIKIGSFDSVAGFFGIYDHLVKPHNVPTGCVTDYHLFREGITPTWEDARNKNGGKWIMRLRKTDGLSSLYWEELLLAIIGEQFDDLTNHICGAVVSIRANDDIISLWNADASDQEATNKIRDTIREKLELPTFITLEYKRHSLSRNHLWRAQNKQDRDRPRLTHSHGHVPRTNHSHTTSQAQSTTNERDWSTLRSRNK